MVDVVPVTTRFPVRVSVLPSKVRFDSTVAFGAVPFSVMTPLSVDPLSDSSPLVPDDPDEPLDPDDPEDPEVPLEPEVPELPLAPL